MKIGIIGPTYPFRGGIAHHTTLLCNTLRRAHTVKFISFSRQYPKFLFPGTTDRDPSTQPMAPDEVEYLIDALNPLSWVRAAGAMRRFGPELVLLPWWVAFWAPQYLTVLTLLRRRGGPRIVFLCHNVAEHEANPVTRLLTRWVLNRAHRIVTQSEGETAKLRGFIRPGIEVATGFHPTYGAFFGKPLPKARAKARLGLKGGVLLHFGHVRPYKGLDVLLEAMSHVLKARGVTLLVVGEFWKGEADTRNLIARLGIGEAVRIENRYVPNEEMEVFFAAADLVVQPYRSASGSGITQLALGRGRPVIATAVGGLPEAVRDGVDGRIVPPADPPALARAIVESLRPAVLARLTRAAGKAGARFSWEQLAALITGDAGAAKAPAGGGAARTKPGRARQ